MEQSKKDSGPTIIRMTADELEVDEPKRRGRPSDLLVATAVNYFLGCKPYKREGPHPTVAGLKLHCAGTPPKEAMSRIEAHLEDLLSEGNGEAIHSLRKHFGW